MNYNQNRTILGGNTNNTNANVSASLSNMNISNLNVTNISNASINNLGFSNVNVNEVNNASIANLQFANIIATSVATAITNLTIQSAQMQTFRVQTPNQGVIILQESNTPGLSTLAQDVLFGMSSISSIISYGLSTVYSPYGISSLSSIVSYGLSSLGGVTSPGISSLSSIVSYGLSTVYSPYGISSLSSIVSYGLSSVTFIGTNTFGHTFLPSSIGGTDINDGTSRPGLDTITDAFAKIDNLFEKLISKPPAPVLWENGEGEKENIVGLNLVSFTFSNPPQYFFNGMFVPDILYSEFSLSYSDDRRPAENTNPYPNSNLFTYRIGPRVNTPGFFFFNGKNNITATTISIGIFADIQANSGTDTTESNRFNYEYKLNNMIDSNEFLRLNPYIFKFMWTNSATYPPTDNYFTTSITFSNNPRFSLPPVEVI